MRFVTVLGICALLGCGGGHDPGDCVAHVLISGAAEAWEGVRSITVEGKTVRLPSGPVGSQSPQAEVSLCTTDREAFLRSDTLAVEVTLGDDRVVRSPIERIACHVAQDPGYAENIAVELKLDGTIDADYGSKPSIYDTCSYGSSWLCEKDEL